MFGFPFNELNFIRNFSVNLRCYSVMMMPGQEREDVDVGGKIILPPSALDVLSRLNIQYPMLFRLRNSHTERETHCGVLEFIAEEGRCYLPHWMMRNLLLDEGDVVSVENVSLPVATFTKFQPQSVDFLDISNPKVVLEKALRNFACLTAGDMIAIRYNDKSYEMCVLETKPAKAVSIIECDMNVEFDAPVGYKEPIRNHQAPEDEEEFDYTKVAKPRFSAFQGMGTRLDGKKQVEGDAAGLDVRRGVPNYDYRVGNITFIRRARKKDAEPSKAFDFSAFSGRGETLRSKKK